jgi:sigma-E factor negative regulatory protein RseA
MNNPIDTRQTVCALADGQLQGQDFARAVALTCADAEARATWAAYHVVGDVLRSPDLARCAVREGFMERLQIRLRDEKIARPVAQPGLHRVAANDPVFRWKLVAGLASLAAVAAVGWNLLGAFVLPMPTGASLATLAAPSATVAVASDNVPMVMIRDPHLDALLAAHKQLSGPGALPGVTGFLRNATFEGASR